MNRDIVERLEGAFKVFVTESNRIENINRRPTVVELRAHALLVASPELHRADLVGFVAAVAPGKPLRTEPFMNVRVGSHVAPQGGHAVVEALDAILARANDGDDPWTIHRDYEHLHPFMDGNGRSGRAIWLWQMARQNRQWFEWALETGFLRLFYYQTLSQTRAGSEAAAEIAALRKGLDCFSGELVRFAYQFVREQSEGEWGDDLVAKDAERLIAGVRALIKGDGR